MTGSAVIDRILGAQIRRIHNVFAQSLRSTANDGRSSAGRNLRTGQQVGELRNITLLTADILAIACLAAALILLFVARL